MNVHSQSVFPLHDDSPGVCFSVTLGISLFLVQGQRCSEWKVGSMRHPGDIDQEDQSPPPDTAVALECFRAERRSLWVNVIVGSPVVWRMFEKGTVPCQICSEVRCHLGQCQGNHSIEQYLSLSLKAQTQRHRLYSLTSAFKQNQSLMTNCLKGHTWLTLRLSLLKANYTWYIYKGPGLCVCIGESLTWYWKMHFPVSV